MSTVPVPQHPMGLSQLQQVLEPDLMYDVMSVRQQSRIPAPSATTTPRYTNGDGDRYRRNSPPSPASFSPLESFSEHQDQRVRAEVRDFTPQKSPPLRSSRPRQQVSAVNSGSAKSSLESESPERPIPGAFRDSYSERPQSPIANSADKSAPVRSSDEMHLTASETVAPINLAKLSSAVYYRQDRPSLLLNPGTAGQATMHTPGSDTELEDDGMDIEKDVASPAGRQEPQIHKGPIDGEIHVGSHPIDASHAGDRGLDGAHRDPRHAPRLSVQTNHVKRRPAPQFIPQIPYRPSQASPAIAQEADNAGTIDIVLDPSTSFLDPSTADSERSDARIHSEGPPYELQSTLSDRNNFERMQEPLSAQSGWWQADGDNYSTLNSIIDDYQWSGSLSPQAIHHLQENVFGYNATPDRIETYVKDHISRQNSQTSRFTHVAQPQFVRTAGPAFVSIDAPHQQASAQPSLANSATNDAHTPTSSSLPRSSKIESDHETASTATPLPNRLSSLTATSIVSDQPSLPEIPNTGGGLGLLNADTSQPGALLDAARIGPTPRSAGSSLGSQRPYAGSVDSQQATGGQQEISETPPTSMSRPQSFRSTEQSSRKPSVDNNGPPSPERERQKQRQKVMQELVDTEHGYYQDMTVMEDIYKGTATDCAELSLRDIASLFGNITDVVRLSREFADRLKEATRGVYIRPKSSKPTATGEPDRESSLSASSSSRVDLTRDELDDGADRQSSVGEVFLGFLPRMEKIYTDYIKNAGNANDTLKRVMDEESVKLWLQECHEYAKDLTEAWDLNALIIKPTQRITRYPLLLDTLKKYTPDNHPDYRRIQDASQAVLGVNERINAAKQRLEQISSATNSDLKKTTIFNSLVTWTDRTKQKMGKVETFEDQEFSEVMSKFSTETHKVSFVLRDFHNHLVANENVMKAMTDVTRCLETVVDIKPSQQPEIESKWRRYIMIVRELLSIGYPDHVSVVPALANCQG